MSQLEQHAKLSPSLLALYSSKLRRRILLKFDNDTSFNPNELFTSLSCGTVSFHFQFAERTSVTTFFLHVRTRDLCGMWLADLSTMHWRVAVAWTVCALGFRRLILPCICATMFSDAYLAYQKKLDSRTAMMSLHAY